MSNRQYLRRPYWTWHRVGDGEQEEKGMRDLKTHLRWFCIGLQMLALSGLSHEF